MSTPTRIGQDKNKRLRILGNDLPARDSIAVSFCTIAFRRARYAAPTAYKHSKHYQSEIGILSWFGTKGQLTIVVVVTTGKPTGT